MTAATLQLDQSAIEQATATLVTQYAGWHAITAAAMGARLGLFDVLAAGPTSPTVLAQSAGVSARYATEWSHLAYCAGLLTHDSATNTFALAPGFEAVLVDRENPFYLGSALGFVRVIGQRGLLPRLEEAFVDGKGVPQAEYGSDMQSTLEAMSSMIADHLLVQSWVPAVPGLAEKLHRGVDFADVGCGGGRMIIRLAQAFPNSRFTGIDRFGPALELAHAKVTSAGLGDRIRLEQSDGSTGLPGMYDVVSAFDVVHDAADPVGLLRSMKASLRPGGICLVQEGNAPDELASLSGPVGTFLYGNSLLYCMSVSLGEGGVGLGAVFPQSRLAEVAREAGFDSVVKAAESPFFAFYSLA